MPRLGSSAKRRANHHTTLRPGDQCRLTGGPVESPSGQKATEPIEEDPCPLTRRRRFGPLEQLCLSPQCGFSSTVEGNILTYDQEVAKLRLIVETAQEVWG